MLYLCPICQRTKDGVANEVIHDSENKPLLKHKWKHLKHPCSSCMEYAKDAVMITCDACDSVTFLDPKVFEGNENKRIKAGSIVWVKTCVECDKKFNKMTDPYIIKL